MSKEYLEAFKNLKQELYYSPNQIPDIDKWHEIIERALERLEAIDNANPSEALKRTSSEFIDGYPTGNVNVGMTWEEYGAIKQALLKQQEQENKKYLKWEDLKFTDERQTIKVLLNGEKYFVKYKKEYLFGYYEKVEITNGTYILCTLGNGMKQFFNDLHLERVEE